MKNPPRLRRRRRVIVPPDEHKWRCHRRMDRTAALEERVRAWAQQNGCSLRVLNGGHHWLFRKPGLQAKWWPSSAKLVVNRDYVRDRHAPHGADLVAVLQDQLAPTASGP